MRVESSKIYFAAKIRDTTKQTIFHSKAMNLSFQYLGIQNTKNEIRSDIIRLLREFFRCSGLHKLWKICRKT